MNHLAAIGWAS